VLPLLLSRAKGDPGFRDGRLGRYSAQSVSGAEPRIWFHAASVGEVTGAVPTIRALGDRLPLATVLLTVSTPQGYHFARAQLPEWVRVLPFPLDLPAVLDRAFRALRPSLYVALESEFWPHLFRILDHDKVPALLLNGRLSRRSAGRYRLLHPLFRPVFKQFRRLAMLSEEDRQNVLDLGVERERTLVLGSSKYDGLLGKVDPRKVLAWRRSLGIPPHLPVVVGGSLRRSECTLLLEIFQALPLTEPPPVGIFVPRHLERIPEMARWLRDRSVPFHLLSRLEKGEEERRASVILVDRIGILFELYGLGDLIFCGGTIEPIGGHNILEPAAWQKPVFYGPHLQKVINEHNILQNFGGSFVAQTGDELRQQWSRWIQDLPALRAHGRRAGEALEKLGGAAARQVELILDTLQM
jgi:3-deoxy-D-manno-octulosonic-acid transferase